MKETSHIEVDGVPADGAFRALLDHLLEGCQVIGYDWKYLYLNEAALQHSRQTRADLLGRTMQEAYPGIENTSMFTVLRRCMDERKSGYLENEFTFPDGSTGWFELRIEPVPAGIFILSIDISARKKTEADLRRIEEQFRHAQKMEAMGRLAAGVAHDFNNLLTIVSLSTSLLRSELPPGSRHDEPLEQIELAGERAATLTRQLLAFSRQQVLAPEVLAINRLISDAGKMLGRLIGEDIRVETDLAPDAGQVLVDPGQVEQIVLNLAINARDAMPQGGRLMIQTRNVELDAGYAESHIEVQPGPYVLLAVSDTGCGMDRETMAHIFEPFFTTKPQGKGTGLGLSTVFGIVRQSGGYIWVYSEPGDGTSFKIYLPRVTADGVQAAATPAAQTTTAGNETVLLVEDDTAVRDATARTLEMAGYRVLAAATGMEAVTRCAQHRGPVHLLLTDVIMPEMNGRQVAEAVRALYPDARVLFMSGYTDDAVLRHGIEPSLSGFLQKPFTPGSLVRKVREVLG